MTVDSQLLLNGSGGSDSGIGGVILCAATHTAVRIRSRRAVNDDDSEET